MFTIHFTPFLDLLCNLTSLLLLLLALLLECDFVVHRKCEQKVVIDCSTRMEQSVLHRDKVEESAAAAILEDEETKTKEVGAELDGGGGWLGLGGWVYVCMKFLYTYMHALL